jgi:hypothetical protein
MSTKLKLTEPKNVLVFTTEEDFLTAEWKVTKTRVNKKETVEEYSVLWWLSSVVDEKPTVIGAMRTGLDLSEMNEGDDPAEHHLLRIQMLGEYAGHIIRQAYDSKTPDILLEDEVAREVIIGIHAKWHSQMMHGLEYAEAATMIRDFIKEFGAKNVKKVLAAVLDVKVESA